MSNIEHRTSKLYQRRRFGIKLGLDVEKKLLAALGSPEKGLSIIHVAGTNGKGSVCAILESIARNAGYRTGLYTSPHLIRLNERFRVDGRDISDGALERLMAGVESEADMLDRKGRQVTFFECTTAMALAHFKDENVDLAILETGMGGRCDATNAVQPVLSMITRISVDHSEHLGGSLEEIAREKAGILKTGVPAVICDMDAEPLMVIREVAAEKNVLLCLAGDMLSVTVKDSSLSGQKVFIESESGGYGTMDFPLPGKHQVENLALAIAGIEMLGSLGWGIPAEAVRAGVSGVHWPGRMQILCKDPPVVLDGAHNPAASEALAVSIGKMTNGRKIGLVLGMCSDKDMKGFLKPWSGLVERMWAVGFKNERSMDSGRIAEAGRTMGWKAEQADLTGALQSARGWADAEGAAVCVTGSLFLVGEVLENINE